MRSPTPFNWQVMMQFRDSICKPRVIWKSQHQFTDINILKLPCPTSFQLQHNNSYDLNKKSSNSKNNNLINTSRLPKCAKGLLTATVLLQKTRGEPHHYLSWANWMFLASLIHIYHICYQCHKSYNLYVSSRKKNTKHKKIPIQQKHKKKSMFNVYCLRLTVLLNNEYNYFCLNWIDHWMNDHNWQLLLDIA